MEFINASYFTKGPRKIDNARGSLGQSLVTQAAATTIEGYIEFYQRDFLIKVFGMKLGCEYNDYLEGEETDEEKESVLDHLRDAFADYVMYHFLRGQQTSSSTVGEKQLKGGNDTKSAAGRQAQMWNDMVTLMRMFVLWAQEHRVVACVDKSLLEKINVYGL